MKSLWQNIYVVNQFSLASSEFLICSLKYSKLVQSFITERSSVGMKGNMPGAISAALL